MVDAPETPKPHPSLSTDWSLCLICQEVKAGELRCPADSKRNDFGTGYKTLEKDLLGFQSLGKLPVDLKLDRLNDGAGIANTFHKNKGFWHKTCRDKYNQTKLNRLKKKRSSLDEIQEEETIPKLTRASCSFQKSQSTNSPCFFCNKVDPEEDLVQAQTFGIDSHVRIVALKLGDTELLSKLSAGDMIAIGARYHLNCLVKLYNRNRAASKQQSEKDDISMIESIAFAELIAYIEDTHKASETTHVFYLSELAKLYISRLDQLGVKQVSRIHSTRLKDKLLVHIPGLSAHTKGRSVLLAFDADVGQVLADACSKNFDLDAICLAKAAQIIRKDLFDNTTDFNGQFSEDCQKMSISNSLLTLVRMILEGPNIIDQQEYSVNQASLSIAQLIKFNSVKHTRSRKSQSIQVRHSHNQETPLPMYLGVLVHAKTRNRGLIDKLFELGISISYDSVLRLSSDLANAVCDHYVQNNVVCPPQLLAKVFTTAAVDNIDHNPSSTTATGSFHGTGISLFQNPTLEHSGINLGTILFESHSTSKVVNPLPEFYTNIPPATLSSKTFSVPSVTTKMDYSTKVLDNAVKDEYLWMEKVKVVIEEHGEEENLSWSAYHAQWQTSSSSVKCIAPLLPLFEDNSHSIAMIRHSMEVISKAVHYLNPGQSPVVAYDQPLFALAKQIQWTWTESFGEDKVVVMLGGLHIEMAFLKTLGNWLAGSGWIDALVQANIATSGTAESYLHVSHVTRTRYVHQVTASTLHILQRRAFESDINMNPETHRDFQKWIKMRCTESPQFQYWSITLELELTLLMFVRALREANFDLYIETLMKMTPWFFALNHTHYARWVPVHIRDMMELPTKHASTAAEFQAGRFVVQKTTKAFSAIGLDQAHEQNNEMIKGDGGAIGLTENPAALRRWMVAGPECARLISEFEESLHRTTTASSLHHEQTQAIQERFRKHVHFLVELIEDLGNPFEEKGQELLTLTTKDIAHPSVAATVMTIQGLGLQQYNEYVKDRLIDRTKSLQDVIPQNKLQLFSSKIVKNPSKDKLKLMDAKNACQLFSKLYIGCQNRESNLEEFFSHENQSYPPSLSDAGKLKLGSKSDLLTCLERLITVDVSAPAVSVIILDGAAVVQMLRPGTSKNFEQYFHNIFLPFIESQLEMTQRLDIVWDEYLVNSLKASTREKRGSGSRKRVLLNVPMPKNWQNFLCHDLNKKELFNFLSQQSLEHCKQSKHIYITEGQNVLCTQSDENLENLSPCNHEEADSRIFVHMADAAQKGYRKIMVRTVDTDVVVLAVAAFHALDIEELWVAFGTGKNFRYLPAHHYATILGEQMSKALPFFHAFSGCDTVSAFCGRGKKTAWDVWMAFPEATDTFLELSNCPVEISDTCFATLERFVVQLYDRNSNLNNVDEARKYLFTKKGRSLEGIPPTRAALLQHAKRTVYQAGHIWAQSMVPLAVIPDPTDWGWTLNYGTYEPLWTTLAEAAKICSELTHCGCKVACTSRCKCVRASLPCTPLCACDGQCARD